MKRFLFWKRGKLIHDEELCVNCGLCIRRCPHKALKKDKKTGKWKLVGICVRCNRCVRECPQQALKIERTDD